MATSSPVVISVPRYTSPNEPLPILQKERKQGEKKNWSKCECGSEREKRPERGGSRENVERKTCFLPNLYFFPTRLSALLLLLVVDDIVVRLLRLFRGVRKVYGKNRLKKRRMKNSWFL